MLGLSLDGGLEWGWVHTVSIRYEPWLQGAKGLMKVGARLKLKELGPQSSVSCIFSPRARWQPEPRVGWGYAMVVSVHWSRAPATFQTDASVLEPVASKSGCTL